ncbi:slipin family protein [Chamaesiphon sp. GL140_3_metabinner_50]|uniref:slipin family protein n=1 Tax=Chamaesiphon sp. GL140_3_metabinner_50 TaxID=2970812 RepID=UPI0025FC03CE|nr:slipin family protein [Chamaesiphon sp. GL140_3_metabinner_50]
MEGFGLAIAAAMLAAIVKSGIRVDREYERGVIFHLGRFQQIKGPGLYFIVPVLDQKVQVDIRTKTVDIAPQEAVTADSVTIKINAVLYYRIIDPMKAIARVENYQVAVYQASMTTLRNIVGQHSLDEMLQGRDKINAKVQEIVDEITEPWGVEIERVELKDVEIPISMQRAMAKEAEAAREKRARLIKAEAEQEASKLLSEAAQEMMQNPAALELRRLQMLTEIGAENNTTTLVMIPSDIISLAKEWSTAAHNSNMNVQANAAKAQPQISDTLAVPQHQLNASTSAERLQLPTPVEEIGDRE